MRKRLLLLETFQVVHQGFLLRGWQIGIAGHFGVEMELAGIGEGYLKLLGR